MTIRIVNKKWLMNNRIGIRLRFHKKLNERVARVRERKYVSNVSKTIYDPTSVDNKFFLL